MNDTITSSFEHWDAHYPIINFERTFACGHTAVFTNNVHKYKPYNYRAQFADQFATTTKCWECRQAEMPNFNADPHYSEQVNAALSNMEVFDLPMLEDQDATTLHEALRLRDAMLVWVLESLVTSKVPAMSEEKYEQEVLAYARQITETQFWATQHVVWVTDVAELLQATVQGREPHLKTPNQFEFTPNN